jgi:hypothetical protein
METVRTQMILTASRGSIEKLGKLFMQQDELVMKDFQSA